MTELNELVQELAEYLGIPPVDMDADWLNSQVQKIGGHTKSGETMSRESASAIMEACVDLLSRGLARLPNGMPVIRLAGLAGISEVTYPDREVHFAPETTRSFVNAQAEVAVRTLSGASLIDSDDVLSCQSGELAIGNDDRKRYGIITITTDGVYVVGSDLIFPPGSTAYFRYYRHLVEKQDLRFFSIDYFLYSEVTRVDMQYSSWWGKHVVITLDAVEYIKTGGATIFGPLFFKTKLAASGKMRRGSLKMKIKLFEDTVDKLSKDERKELHRRRLTLVYDTIRKHTQSAQG
ncbi:hypothetical protein EU538_03690 [Candidatus Thorarchaeota archaeon]|nr:MAG: hypothetical protein EU538_03690 [Candidatus Thorarchaeota archaeon]